MEEKTKKSVLTESKGKDLKISKIQRLFEKYKEIILYGIFGVLTTVVNILVYYFCTRISGIGEYASNVIAWILSVSFAFITNKTFVFHSKKRDLKTVLKESLFFFGFRLASLGIDMVSMYLMISILSFNDLIAKVLANVIVIILNYICSKLFVFQKAGK